MSIKYAKKLNRGQGIEGPVSQAVIYIIMSLVLFLVVLPLIITILNSLKTNFELYQGVWAWPMTPKWGNWVIALNGIRENLINSIIICLAATFGVVFLSSIVAYTFVRCNFPGKDIIFSAIVALMVVPFVLTVTPSYLLMVNLNLKNTWWALILPYISGGQIYTIFLFRTFIGQQPSDLFEAAKIDGANHATMYLRICIPLAIPILAIQAVSTFAATYNDYLWPILVIEDQKKQTMMAIIQALSVSVSHQNAQDGIQHAMFLLSGIPLIFTTVIGLKYFINGDFASGIKM